MVLSRGPDWACLERMVYRFAHASEKAWVSERYRTKKRTCQLRWRQHIHPSIAHPNPAIATAVGASVEGDNRAGPGTNLLQQFGFTSKCAYSSKSEHLRNQVRSSFLCSAYILPALNFTAVEISVFEKPPWNE